MPRILTHKDIYLKDYLWYGGFDSENENIGWWKRDTVLGILNKHLKDTEIEAKPFDGSGGSGRNNCLIEFYFNDKEVEPPDSPEEYWAESFWIGLFSDNNYRIKSAEASAKEIVAAFNNANMEINEVLLDDISRVINTPDKDLPLLIDTLKDETAIKLLERLLKGASYEQ